MNISSSIKGMTRQMHKQHTAFKRLEETVQHMQTQILGEGELGSAGMGSGYGDMCGIFVVKSHDST